MNFHRVQPEGIVDSVSMIKESWNIVHPESLEVTSLAAGVVKAVVENFAASRKLAGDYRIEAGKGLRVVPEGTLSSFVLTGKIWAHISRTGSIFLYPENMAEVLKSPRELAAELKIHPNLITSQSAKKIKLLTEDVKWDTRK